VANPVAQEDAGKRSAMEDIALLLRGAIRARAASCSSSTWASAS